jgi:hypothetical protein
MAGDCCALHISRASPASDLHRSFEQDTARNPFLFLECHANLPVHDTVFGGILDAWSEHIDAEQNQN